jgi:uncharacterized membrane protein
LEITLIRLAWTFNLDYAHFFLAGVIWMLGWCMILLAAFVFLPTRTIGVTGLAIIFLQQVFGLLPKALPYSMRVPLGRIWEFIYPAGLETWPGIFILYVLVPWIGVMMAGYAFGTILIREPVVRRKLCLRIGLSATALFLVAGSLVALLNPGGATAPPFLFRLLAQNKYPASQLYLLMTLGPLIALVPFAEKAHGWLADVLTTFGRVPLFYYLLHIPLIHSIALLLTFLREGKVYPGRYAQAPFAWVPEEHRWGLPLLYLVFVIVIVLLYFPCRWFAGLKARHKWSWLRYL